MVQGTICRLDRFLHLFTVNICDSVFVLEARRLQTNKVSVGALPQSG